MLKSLTLIAVGLVMSGCCSLCPPKIETVYVQAPCSPPVKVLAPTLTTPLLTEKSTSREVIEAYVFDVEELKTYSGKLEASLAPYFACKP